jgi:hypothetical protein
MSEGSFWPTTWREALPLLVWGVLIFAFGFEAVSSLIHGEWWQAVFGFGGMLGLTAMLIYWTRIQKLNDIRWLVAASMVALIVVAFSPYVEQQRWPFVWQFSTPAPPVVIHEQPAPADIAKVTAVDSSDERNAVCKLSGWRHEAKRFPRPGVKSERNGIQIGLAVGG